MRASATIPIRRTLDSPDGHEIAGSGFSATLRDYGRFGLFVLQGGVIGGQNILPDGWTIEAARPTTLPSGYRVGYGYMWWPVNPPSDSTDVAFSAIGIFGQALYIDPREQLVIVQWSAHTKPAGGQIVNSEDAFRAVAAALH